MTKPHIIINAGGFELARKIASALSSMDAQVVIINPDDSFPVNADRLIGGITYGTAELEPEPTDENYGEFYLPKDKPVKYRFDGKPKKR